MQQQSKNAKRVQFGPFQLNLDTGDFHKNGTRIRLQGQPLAVLTRLLDTPGELVTREELRRQLWTADTFVDFDQGLNNSIQRLRDVLGDDAASPQYIETIPKRGYRFIGPIPQAELAAPDVPRTPESKAGTRSPSRRTSILLIAIALLAVLAGWRFGARSGPAPLLAERRLTSNSFEAPIRSAAVSPDGKVLIYSDPTGVYLRQVDSGETNSLSLPVGFDFLPESWFPDAVHLAGTSLSGQGIPKPGVWKVSIFGGSPQQLSDDGWGPQVSPDGSHVAFLRGGDPLFGFGTAILILDQAGNTRQLLVAGKNESFESLTWSPAGQRIAYLRHHPNDLIALETLSLDGSQPRVILRDRQLGRAVSWATEGRLIYSRRRESQNVREEEETWSLRINPGTGEVLGSPRRISTGRGTVVKMHVTADGRHLSFLRNNLAGQVFVADFTKDHLSAARRLTLDDSYNVPFSWTPDSQHVLFISDRSGTSKIYRQNLRDNVAELLVGGPERYYSPRLSPEGSHIFYLAVQQRGDLFTPVALMRKPLAGGPATLVLSEPGIADLQCAVLPSQVCLYLNVEGGDGKHSIFYFDEKGKGKELKLPNNPDAFSLAPDGDKVASTIRTRNGVAVQIYSLSTGLVRQIPLHAGQAFGLDWHPTEESFFVTRSISNETNELLYVKSNGESYVLLRGNILWAIPSPDGQHLAFYQFAGEDNVWTLDDF